MNTFRDMVSVVKQKLEEVGIEGAAREARLIAASAVGVERDRIAISMNEPVDSTDWQVLGDILPDRLERRPLSHLLGYRDFFKHRFQVSRQVLDPRPETEILVEIALAGRFNRVLDLGTGSGAIVISLLVERPQVEGLATDYSDDALKEAQGNAKWIGVEDRCQFLRSDWFAAINGGFDLIVSNPPYISLEEMDLLEPELAFEPRMALTDEGDGLSAYRAIAKGLPEHLTPGGRVLVEIGPTQARAVSEMFAGAGLENIDTHPDLDGRDRVVSAKMSV